jgi:hypothetical protein
MHTQGTQRLWKNLHARGQLPSTVAWPEFKTRKNEWAMHKASQNASTQSAFITEINMS